MVADSDSKSLYASSATPADRNIPLDNSHAGISERDGHNVPTHDATGYSILEQPMGTLRPLRVILMGAGASSLNFFKQAEISLPNVRVTCYEKNADVGGTWYENRYPGCACDIPSVNYQFSWRIRVWTHYYSSSREIWRYLKDIEEENDFIKKYVKLRHQVERVEWDEEVGVWRVRVRDLVTDTVVEDEAEFFINAGGVLNKWRWPAIPGLHDFGGKLMHSANYDDDYDLAGKRVAVIGAGSSGVQIVARVQKSVEHLYHWVRTPIWITAGFGQTWAGKDGANFAYTDEQKRFLEENPEQYLRYRKQIENELNQRFKFIIKGSAEATAAREYADNEMRTKLRGDERLCDRIIPKNFNPGCRRPTPAPGYLEALVAENSTIFTDPIGSITPTGFIDHDGVEHAVDVIICATGFDTSWLPAFPFIAHGRDLRDIWTKNNVTPYLSIGVPNFPNHFSFCGPYGPLGHGSFMPLIEQWTRYMFSAIRKVQRERIKSITPRLDVSMQFRAHADLFLQRTAWTSACRSWFKQGREDGQAAVYPGSRLHFLELLREVRWEDYDIKYLDENRFRWLGNGFEMREFDGRDITDYLGLLGGEDRQPVYGDELLERLAGWAIKDAA